MVARGPEEAWTEEDEMDELEAELKKLAIEARLAIAQNETFLRNSISVDAFGARISMRPTAMMSRASSIQGED